MLSTCDGSCCVVEMPSVRFKTWTMLEDSRQEPDRLHCYLKTASRKVKQTGKQIIKLNIYI